MNNNDVPLQGIIVEHNREHYKIRQENREYAAVLAGNLRHRARESADFPVVGDLVDFKTEGDTSVITAIQPRRSLLSRKVAGVTTEEQPLAANADLIFIVMALDGGRNYSLRALERYLTLAWNSGGQPAVLLNKADLSDNPDIYRLEAETVSPGVDVLLCSAFSGEGVDAIRDLLTGGKTAVFIGPSGVGKSALTNALLGTELRQTGANRDSDKRGRHTTTCSRLLPLEGGASLIDSPGLKEIQLWGEASALEDTFSEIAALAEDCRFRDCRHQGEPGCAVQQALTDGELDTMRYQSYLELQKELEHLEEKQRRKDRPYEEGKGKKLARYIKNMGKTVY